MMLRSGRCIPVFAVLFAFSIAPLAVAQEGVTGPLQRYSDESKHQAERAARLADEGTPEERAALAEKIVADREQQSGREFDPTIRGIIVASLARKPAAVLREMSLKPAPLNVGDTSVDLSFTPLSPCRIIDTRLGGGPIAAGSMRNFVVAGNGTGFPAQGGTAGGCGVPVGATSVLINFVAVNPQGGGNLKGSAFPNSIPATGSILNYQALNPALNIANGLAFPICDPSVSTCTFDMTLLANASGTDVVADVLGYFSRFKKEQVRSFAVQSGSFLNNAAITNTCSYTGGSITVNAPVAGTVHVRANFMFRIFRPLATNIDEWDVDLTRTPGTCLTDYGIFGLDRGLFDEPGPTGFYFRTVPLDATYSVTAGSHTFYLDAIRLTGTSTDTAQAQWYGMIAVFHPN